MTLTVPDDVRRFLDRVRERLDDLPAQEREDLLTDVEPSVLAGAEESDAPVEARLGTPERFADELRAAAGLPPRSTATAPAGPRPSFGARLAERVRPLRAPAHELAPVWWVARGYVAVCVLAAATGGEWTGLPFRDTGVGATVLAVLAGVAVSVAIGLRRRPWTVAAVVVNAALLVLAVPLAAVVIDDIDGGSYVSTYSEPVMPTGLSVDGSPVDNVFAYDREGRLLYDVRLYDGAGRPLDIGAGTADPDRRVPRTAAGAPAFNAFPIRYFEPGTRTVAHPAAGAPRAPAPLAGAPLVRPRDGG